MRYTLLALLVTFPLFSQPTDFVVDGRLADHLWQQVEPAKGRELGPHHVEVEAVQAHRVRLHGQIEHAPAHTFADASSQPLGVRP